MALQTIDGRCCTGSKTRKKCEYYRYDVRRCGLGKVLPSSIKGGAQMYSLMGAGYICPYLDEIPRYKIVKKATLAATW